MSNGKYIPNAQPDPQERYERLQKLESELKEYFPELHTAFTNLRLAQFRELPGAVIASDGRAWLEAPGSIADTALLDYPLHMFNPILREYIKCLQDELQVPLEAVAITVLGLLSAALTNKRYRVRLRGSWIQHPVLFLAITMLSGDRKSAIIEQAAAPLKEYEAELFEEKKVEVAEIQSARRVKEAELKNLEELKSKAKTTTEADSHTARIKTVIEELAKMPKAYPPRLLTHDVTPESIIRLLLQQGASINSLSPEGAQIFENMIRYGNNGMPPNLSIFLQAWDAEDYFVDRRQSEELIRAPLMTLLLMIQPVVLERLRAIPEMAQRGLLPRFIFCHPKSLQGAREAEPPIMGDNLRKAYRHLIWRLCKLDAAGERLIELSPEANQLFICFRKWLEPQLAEFGDLADIAGWASKLPSQVGRVTALLHIVSTLDDGGPFERGIDEQTMQHAIDFGKWAISHAKAAIGSMNQEQSDAYYLWRWLHRNDTPMRSGDVWRAVRGHFNKEKKRYDAAIEVLIDLDYIRQIPYSEAELKAGRPPSPMYELNPHARKRTG